MTDKKTFDGKAYLGTVLELTNLNHLPGVRDEVDFLLGRLDNEELGAVARLLDHALIITHRVDHLPPSSALTTVGEWWAASLKQRKL